MKKKWKEWFRFKDAPKAGPPEKQEHYVELFSFLHGWQRVEEFRPRTRTEAEGGIRALWATGHQARIVRKNSNMIEKMSRRTNWEGPTE